MIRMYVTIPNGRVEYSTGIKVDSKNFDKEYLSKGKEPIKNSASESDHYNSLLSSMKSEAIRLSEIIRVNGEEVSTKEFKSKLDQKFKPKRMDNNSPSTFIDYLELWISQRESGKKLNKNGKSFKRATIRKAKTLRSSLYRFIKHLKKRDLKFEEINDVFYERYKKFNFDVEKKSISTFSNLVKDIKTVINEAIEDGFIQERRYSLRKFISPTYESDSVALTLDQLELIHQVHLEDESLDKARDFFLIGCYTALRYSDLMNLTDAKVSNGYIRVKQIKTDGFVTIPISKRVEPIFEKYPNKFPKIDFGLHAYNTKVRKVAKLAGLDKFVQIRRSNGGHVIVEEKRLFELISSHTARRTYATNMFKLGLPTSLIMAVTGHKTESSFLLYIKATNEDKARMMMEMMKKLDL